LYQVLTGIILAISKIHEEPNPFIIQKYFPMKQDLEMQALPTGKVLFKLTVLGCVLLGCVYGFLVLFNTALEAIK